VKFNAVAHLLQATYELSGDLSGAQAIEVVSAQILITGFAMDHEKGGL
jgi:hypothetical protein